MWKPTVPPYCGQGPASQPVRTREAVLHATLHMKATKMVVSAYDYFRVLQFG